MEVMNGFKKFILRGNVVDLAVGLAVGAAFTGIVNSFVKDLITPLVGAFFNSSDLSGIAFTINGSKFAIGDFLNALVSFLIIATVVYFFVVLPMNKFLERMKGLETPADPTSKKCPECLSEIPLAATRCAHCAQPQPESDIVSTLS